MSVMDITVSHMEEGVRFLKAKLKEAMMIRLKVMTDLPWR